MTDASMRSTHFAGQGIYAYGAFDLLRRAHTLAVMDYKAFKKAFGSAVRERRQAMSKTQPELADTLIDDEPSGIDQGGLSRIERGVQGFDSDTLFKLAKALETPVYKLFGGHEAPASRDGLSPEAIRVAQQYQALGARNRYALDVVLKSLGETVTEARMDESEYGSTRKRRGARTAKVKA